MQSAKNTNSQAIKTRVELIKMVKSLKICICLLVIVIGGLLPVIRPAACQPVFTPSSQSHIQNITWVYGPWRGDPRYPYLGGYASIDSGYFQVDKVRATVNFPDTPNPSVIGGQDNWLACGIYSQAQGGVEREDYAFYSAVVLDPNGNLWLDIGAWVDHEVIFPTDWPPTCNLDFHGTWQITGVDRSTPITLTMYWGNGTNKIVYWLVTMYGQDYPLEGASFDVGAVHPSIMKKFYVGEFHFFWPGYDVWCYYFQFGIMSPQKITQGGWRACLASPQYFKDGLWHDVDCAMSIQGGNSFFDVTWMWGGNTYDGIGYVSGNNWVTFLYDGGTIPNWWPYWPVEEGGGGCPYAYVWNGSMFVKDNNILPASEAENGTDTYDYYKLEQHLVPYAESPIRSFYRLSINENENEDDYIDQVKLMTVDHANNVNIAVTDNGEIVTYQQPSSPLSCIDNNGTDRLSQISSMNGNVSDPATYFQGHDGDWLLLDFGNVTATKANLILRDDQKCMDVCIDVQISNSNGTWQTIDVLHPRSFWGMEAVNMTNYLPTSGDLAIRLLWTAPHRLDYVGLDTSVQAPLVINSSTPLMAVHSVQGNVTLKLHYDDESTVELINNQNVTMTFALPKVPQHLRRDFILFTNGYYYKKTP